MVRSSGRQAVQPGTHLGGDASGRVVVARLQRGEQLARLGPLQQRRAGVDVGGEQPHRAGAAECRSAAAS